MTDVVACKRFLPSKDPIKCTCGRTFDDHSKVVRKGFVDTASDGVIHLVELRRSFVVNAYAPRCEDWKPVRYGEDLILCECGRLIYEHNLGTIVGKMRKQKEDSAVAQCTSTLKLPSGNNSNTLFHCLLDTGHSGDHEHHGRDFSGSWKEIDGASIITADLTNTKAVGANQCQALHKVAEGSYERCVLPNKHAGRHSTYEGKHRWDGPSSRDQMFSPPAVTPCRAEFTHPKLANLRSFCTFPTGHESGHSWETLATEVNAEPRCTEESDGGRCIRDAGHDGPHRDFTGTHWSTPRVIMGTGITPVIDETFERPCGEINPWQDYEGNRSTGLVVCTLAKGHAGNHKGSGMAWIDPTQLNRKWSKHCKFFRPEVDHPGVCATCEWRYVDHAVANRGYDFENLRHLHSPNCESKVRQDGHCNCMTDVGKQTMLESMGEVRAKVGGPQSCPEFRSSADKKDVCVCGVKFVEHSHDARQGWMLYSEWRAHNMTNQDVVAWLIGLGNTPIERLKGLQLSLDNPTVFDGASPPSETVRELADMLPVELRNVIDPATGKPFVLHLKPKTFVARPTPGPAKTPPSPRKPNLGPRHKRKGNGVSKVMREVETPLNPGTADAPRTTCFNCAGKLETGQHNLCTSCSDLLTHGAQA